LLFVRFSHFIPVLFAFIVLGFVSSVLCQEIGKEERLQNDLFFSRVGLSQSTTPVSPEGVSESDAGWMILWESKEGRLDI